MGDWPSYSSNREKMAEYINAEKAHGRKITWPGKRMGGMGKAASECAEFG